MRKLYEDGIIDKILMLYWKKVLIQTCIILVLISANGLSQPNKGLVD